MRIKVIGLSILILSSGENNVRFENPQPEGQRDEKMIPKKMVGTYLSLNDSSIVRIGENQIIKTVNTNISGLYQNWIQWKGQRPNMIPLFPK